MRCRRFHRLFSSYLDGELKPAQKGSVEEHLRGCAECRGALNDLRLLISEAQQLVSASPISDLWPAIERRALARSMVSSAKRPLSAPLHGWRPRIAWALTIVALFTAFFLLQQHIRSPGPTAPSPQSRIQFLTTAKEDIDLANVHYQNSISSLEQIVAHRAHEMNPERLALYQEKLVQLEEAIDECSIALEKNSYDIKAQRALFNAYDRKISTLREMAVSATY